MPGRLALLIVLTLSLAAPVALRGQPSTKAEGPRIPAISGTVVDALSGKPVSGVDVTLRAETIDRKDLRYENCRTSPKGRFRFPSSVEPEAGGLFNRIGQIAITVNIPFISVARMRAGSNENWIKSDAGADASGYLQTDPLFTAKLSYVHKLRLAGPRINNPSYFPMAVQYLKACVQSWDANCISSDILTGIRVPLVPVLDGAAGCRKIAAPDLREGCRQLQTYRAAFRHVETMAQVRTGKEICGQIDHGRISKLCLDHLHSFVLRADQYENRPPLRMEIEPSEEALILTPIAGMQAFSHGLYRPDAFDETAMYTVRYQRMPRTGLDAATVAVELIRDAGERRRRFAAFVRPPPNANLEPRRIELFDGAPLAMSDKGRSSWVVWISGDKLITITLNPYGQGAADEISRRAEVTPELRRALIRAYLRKYPVTN
jgi:hypothetical protein